MIHMTEEEILNTKECNACHRYRPSGCFGKDKKTKDGISNKCKDCRNKHKLAPRRRTVAYPKRVSRKDNKRMAFIRLYITRAEKTKIVEAAKKNKMGVPEFIMHIFNIYGDTCEYYGDI